jgi:2-dehydro-3-deoxygluconokinase
MYDLVSLGEVMLRYSPPKHERLRQATCLEVRACGAEFNVAADLACLGKKTALLSKLPANELGLLARSACMSYGVDVSYIRMVPGARMGVVYVEFGTEPRRGLHLYDRQASAASTLASDDFNWLEVLKDSRLAYTDGIFPGLSDSCRAAALEFVQTAKKVNCRVCFDMNFRASLWKPEEAKGVYEEILPLVDILVTNRSVSQSILGFQGSDEELLEHYGKHFGCQTVCLTSRQMDGTKHGTWKSAALHGDGIAHGRPFQFDVVDRYGTGDAFFAGFLYGYLERDIQFALDFGNALCALSHTIEGDVIQVSVEDVMELLKGGSDFEVRR